MATLPFFITLLVEASCISEQQASWKGDECSSSDSRSYEGRGTSSEQVLLQKATVRASTGVKKPLPKAKKLKAWTVSLSEDGYKEIARLQDTREMAEFITRVAEDLGFEIQDDGGLMGVVPYYNGKKALQSLKALKQELKKAAKKKNGWIAQAKEGTSHKNSKENKGSLKDLEESLNENEFENEDNEYDEANEIYEDEDEANEMNDEAMEMHHRSIRHLRDLDRLRDLEEDYSRRRRHRDFARRHYYDFGSRHSVFAAVDLKSNATNATRL